MHSRVAVSLARFIFFALFLFRTFNPCHMKKILLLAIFAIPSALQTLAQCSMTPNASTFIMSTFTVGNNYTLNSNNTYPISRAFYICQGTTVTIQNRPGNDTFYVAPGGGLIGFEANAFRVFVQGSGSYDAVNSCTPTIYYETGATISNYTCPLLPPCPSLTFNMSQIGSGACSQSTGINQPSFSGNVFLFPNPATSSVRVNSYTNSNDLELLVTDVLGNQVMVKRGISNQYDLDVSGLKAGIYFIRVMRDGILVGNSKLAKQDQ